MLTFNMWVVLRVEKRASPAHLWPAKNRSGRAGPPPINGLDIVTRPDLGRAGLSLFFFLIFNFF